MSKSSINKKIGRPKKHKKGSKNVTFTLSSEAVKVLQTVGKGKSKSEFVSLAIVNAPDIALNF